MWGLCVVILNQIDYLKGIHILVWNILGQGIYVVLYFRLKVSAFAQPLEQIKSIAAFITGVAILTASRIISLSGRSL
ncbi:hypothetical protein [Methanobrevibacter gottschalkii]|uniref:hypothetical protein n=1 Tax=Methanobrevibacter gottschalkii TaxID=190974 RepID=UPI0038D142A5